MKKNLKSLICVIVCVLLMSVCISACGPTSTAKITDTDASAAEALDVVLIEQDGIAYGYRKGEHGGYDLMSLNSETGKLTVHGNTSAYVVYDKSLVFGPCIVIDGKAFVTTTSTEREKDDVSFAMKGVDLFSFGGSDYLEYGRLFEENVVVEKLEEKDGGLVVYIKDAEVLFKITET